MLGALTIFIFQFGLAQSNCDFIFVNQEFFLSQSFLHDCQPAKLKGQVINLLKNKLPQNVMISVERCSIEDFAGFQESQIAAHWDNINVTSNNATYISEEVFTAVGYKDCKRTLYRINQVPFGEQGSSWSFNLQFNTNSLLVLQPEYFVIVRTFAEGCPLPNFDNTLQVVQSSIFPQDYHVEFPLSGSLNQAIMNNQINSWFPSEQVLCFQGNFDIDTDYAFAEDQSVSNPAPVSIYLFEGAGITVKSGKTLNLKGVNIFTCDHLARGIIVEPGATLIADNVNFTDCRFAIDARPGSKLDIRNSHFPNNYLGLNAQLAPGDAPIQLLGFANKNYLS